MKRYMNAALVYSLLAMAGGVFYREFTKFNGFAGKTTLSVVHTHYFLLGMVFFLLLLLLEKNFAFEAFGHVDDDHEAMRFVCSWATKPEAVDALIESL